MATTPLARIRRGADRRAEREVRARVRRRRLLPVPQAAPLERARARLDGLRAEARQARRRQRAAARQAPTSASASRCIVGNLEALAGVRYVITLDSDTQLPRDAAAKIIATMAHPLNRPRFGSGIRRDIVVDGYGILQPRVGAQPAEHQPLRLRAPVRRRAGHRPVHARGLRRLPGPVRRRLVHRQGDLRRRRVRARAGRAPAREPHPQPRPAGGLLRALGAGQRRRAARGIADALQHRRRAPPALDPRRLAADRVAAAARACAAGCAAQSALAALARQDPRQPAPQPRAGSAGRDAGRGVVAAAAVAGVARPGAGDHRRGPGRGAARRHLAPSARARRQRRACGRGAGEPPGAEPAAAGRAVARLPAARGRVQPVGDRAHALARRDQQAPAARVAAVSRRAHQRRSGQRRRPRAHARALAVGPLLALATGVALALLRPAALPFALPVLLLWFVVAASRLVDRPAARAQDGRAERGADRVPAPAGAPHLGVLRRPRRRSRPPPAARQRAGAAGRARRPPDLADQHRASRCWRRSPRAASAISRRAPCSRASMRS